MKEDFFRSWLAGTRNYVRGGVNSRVSNCKTVEAWEGDLDQLFDQDQLCDLLLRLAYSKGDERRNEPARHRIPIDGNVYNGTATLRFAVSLYKQFRETRVEGLAILQPAENRLPLQSTPRVARSLEKQAWPTWNEPGPDKIIALAHLATPFIRFLNPDVVHAIVEDNERHRAAWVEALQVRHIDPRAYLWAKSPCAFPGVRRYAGSREIAVYRGHASHDQSQNLEALTLDDNDYPKQLWSFVFRGRQFSKFGPDGYALAHLADHKDHGNRFKRDFEVIESSEGVRRLFGLYTCPSNTVYTPVSLIKPTDFVGTIRALLVRRAQELYGTFCNILPPFLRIPASPSPEWNVNEFIWADPVGETKNLENFLSFRAARMGQLIAGSQVPEVS